MVFERAPGTARRAFTLLELLIVVAIIALLAAILFPAFSRVRESARRASCASNLKQMALAVIMYGQDNDETLPPTYYGTGAGTQWPLLLYPYLKNHQVFVCPSDSVSTALSYGLNEVAFVDQGDDPTTPPNKVSFGDGTPTIMIGETGLADDYLTPVPNSSKLVAPDDDLNDPYDSRPDPRHFDRCNVAFMDGHVKSLALSAFYLNQTPPDLFFNGTG